MDWTLLFGFFSLISGMICASIAIYLAPYRKKTGARQLMLLMAGISIWTLGYGMEFLSPDLSLKLWWVKVEYVGVSWVGVLIFKFVCTLTGKTDWLGKRRHFLLFVVPVLTIVLALTNELHGLMWGQAHLESNSVIQGIIFKRGNAFWGYTAFSYGMIFWATFILLKAFASSRGLYRKQLTIIIAGIMVPWVFNFRYLFGFQAIQNLDLTPFAFMISGILFAWGLLRYQLLNLLPLAHEAVMDSMGDPVIVMDMNDRVMGINKACSKAFAIQTFTPGQHSAKKMFPELYRLVDAHREKKAVEIEAVLTMKNILLQWDLRISPLLGPKEKQSGWLIVLRDITQQKKAEQELRLARDYVKNIINSMPSILIGVDDKTMITQWNIEAEKMSGILADHARGKSLVTVFPQLAGIIPDVSMAIEKKQVQRQEKTPLVIYPKKFVTDITVYPIVSDNLPGAVIRVDDISERIKIEELMVQSEKMMSVGGLAAGMAHEINNPLAGILQNIQVIKNRLSKPQPANVNLAKKYGIDLDLLQVYMEERGIFHMMDQVHSVGKRAAKIVENMLSFSRKSDSTRSRHSLQDMVVSTLNLMKNDYSLKNQYDLRSMEIIQETQNHLPAVPCEKTKIQQVLFNILKNGSEAMSEAKVASPRFVIRYFLEQHMAAVEIRDNGPGIPEEIQNRIFEPFFTTKKVGVGTGLGLSVSYFIIKENHNGVLTVNSSPGKGTSFIIKLPV